VTRRCSLVPLVAELDQTEYGGESEEQQHRVEEDKPGDTEPSNIYRRSAYALSWLTHPGGHKG
jgi:hypothetical protein